MKKSKEELIQIWLDTESRFGKEYSDGLEYFVSSSSDDIKIEKTSRSTVAKLSVINQDCIEVTGNLSKSGKVLMLNMASYKHPGGGVKRGSMAQEEELARRSNLMAGLPEDAYPLSKDQYIYTHGVTFFKDRNYNIMDSFNSDVITIAAINLNGLPRPDNYAELTKKKIRSIFLEGIWNGCKNVVVSAFGCGVFKNNPTEVASLFMRVIEEGKFDTMYDNITFAILNDHNSVANNYEIFKKIVEK